MAFSLEKDVLSAFEQAPQSLPHLALVNVRESGHFAAWEQPQPFSEEVRATFRSLR
jgi:pimeloyl-ACP methyl ester carboxylesterase